MIGQYILDGHTPVPCEDLLTWARWMEQREVRRVAQDHVGECWVSTVFLGLDHQYGEGPPLLFETMAFGPPQSQEFLGRRREVRPEICSMARYSTWDEAAAGHKRILAEVERYLLDTAISADEALQRIAGKAKC